MGIMLSGNQFWIFLKFYCDICLIQYLVQNIFRKYKSAISQLDNILLWCILHLFSRINP